MMKTSFTSFTCLLVAILATTLQGLFAARDGPVRVLFLGHNAEELHSSDLYYPMLSQALGRDAIYFDYVTAVEEALGDARYLGRFDALLLYANHEEITPAQWENLKSYVEAGGGFVPIHCASWCFQNEPEFDQLVGGRFAHHRAREFQVETVQSEHPVVEDVPELKAWDETYVHKNHNEKDRIVLQVRPVQGPDDNISEPEPWTWVRTQGKGRIFYTASGHDERVWSRSEFHQLLKQGILWAIGEDRRKSYQAFLKSRAPLLYERRGHIPNYENRPEPLKFQFPLPPEESMRYTQAPVGFQLKLFASEPEIVNPICLAWDERGRLWIAESVDYPNELTETRQGNDKIKILEDNDGDGRCDQVKIFATGLNVPTSLTFSHGGVIVAQAPEFIFLKDTDGDDVADLREVLNTGWGTEDTHAGPSNLRYGFDNHIWGTVGYSGYRGPIHRGTGRFSSGIFKMKPDGSDITFLHQFNNNTWGLGFNEKGDVFGSTANNNPGFFGGFPATGYRGQPGRSAKMIADTPVFHPITPNIRQVDAWGRYTSGAGYAFATSANFPAAWRDEVSFVCGPTGNLLGSFRNIREGSGYKAINNFSIIASADEWFSPISAEIGPDGNLWVADWYNFIIQHNPTPSPESGGYQAERGVGNAHINPNRDGQHGRIYRLVWEGAKASNITSLADVSPRVLVEALADDNLFWRLTAQRLLVETKPGGVVPLLRSLTAKGGRGAPHALWALQGMGQLDYDTHLAALLNRDLVLKSNAVQALDTREVDLQMFLDTAIITQKDPRVRRVAFSQMAHFPPHQALKTAIPALFKDPANRNDEWLSLALQTAAANQGVELLGGELGRNLVVNPSLEHAGERGPVGWAAGLQAESEGVSLSLAEGEGNVHTGHRALRVQTIGDGIGSWQTELKVEPYAQYRLSGWIKAHGRLYTSALLSIRGISGAQTTGIGKKSDWMEVEVFFNSGDRRSLIIDCVFGSIDGAFVSSVDQYALFDDLSLQEVVDPTSMAEMEGDADRGRKMFATHEIASCSRCHKVDGSGGDIGPALDGIALRKRSDYLRESLIDPQATMAEGYPVEISPMPPYGVLLSQQEIADMLAYLNSLN